ncbi:MAG: hypothetical protein SGBAC_006377, partial [Bacillariaceae sp.]
EKLKGFSIGGIRGDEDELFPDPSFADDSGNRKLQQGCSSYKVVEVAIAYDSSFCSRVAGGSSDTARSVVEETVARAALLFEEICIRVRLSYLEGCCDPSQDPYRKVTAGTFNNACGSDQGALRAFRDMWEDSRTHVKRDTAHLFHGTNFPGTVRRAVVGSSHVSDPDNSANYLMEASINSASDGISSQSTRSIQNYVNGRSCVSTEKGDRKRGNNRGGYNSEDPDDGESFRLESAQHQGLCVAVQGDLTNGTPVNMERCDDSSASQNWLWNSKTHLVQSAAGNKCLFPSGNARDGARMVVWDCNPSFSYAEWSYYNDRSLRPDASTNKCLDVLDSDRETLQMWQCNGTQDKEWVVRR